jgi:hypothetical protein
LADRDRCTSCGAAVPAETGVCAYCGTATAHDVNVPPPARDRASEKIERFDRLAEHPSFDKWMRWRPTPSATPRVAGGFALRGVLLIAMGVVAAMAFSASRAPGPVLIVPLVFIALGVTRVVRAGAPALRTAQTVETAKAYPALVVTKRTEVTTGEYGRTNYHVTMEFRSGTRREYDVDGAFYGLVAEDDIGVAYIREGDLLHFKKIDV